MQKKSRPESVSGTSEEIVYPQELVEMSNQQLLDEVDALMSLDDPDADDTKRMEQCLALLQERAPVMETYDAEVEWKEMTQEHPLLFQVDPRQEQKRKVRHTSESVTHKRRLTVSVLRWIGVAAVLLVTVIMMTASAFGYNPVQTFLKWANGVIQIYSNPSGIMELPEDSISEYSSLSQALLENGLDDSGCPTWIPRDYKVFSVDAAFADNLDKYSAIYHSERGEILIRVVFAKLEEWVAMEERDDGRRIEIINGLECYIISNLEQCKAGWVIGPYSYLISGQITENELIMMIKSIKQGEI